jgi:ornithine carbamoyltransferase
MRHLLSVLDLTAAEIARIFEISEQLKNGWKKGIREPLLERRIMGLLFEKPSLRTRVSFEAAMEHLGGSCIFLDENVGWGKREPVQDFARILSEYIDVLVFRGKNHLHAEQLATYSSCPVINGLTDAAHPCQALADLYTLREYHGDLKGKRLAFIGDANNVAASLAEACARTGVEFAIASPAGYEFRPEFLAKLKHLEPTASIVVTRESGEAVRGAIGVYTDVWVSMGQEAEVAARAAAFKNYQVTSNLMARAGKNASFLHCLPARRGEEVTDEVIDGPQSVIVTQAANRMHVQKGILAWILGAKV